MRLVIARCQVDYAGRLTAHLPMAKRLILVKSDGRWIVRVVAGATTVKHYRCPGCDQLIAPGTPHVVVWPDVPSLLSESGIEERRHWHTPCWQRRR